MTVFTHSAKRALLLSAVAGATLGLATPPIDFYPAAWLGQVLFAYVLFADETPPIHKQARWAWGALRGLFFGTAVNVVVLRFVPVTIERFTDLPLVVALLALLLLSIFQGLRWAVASWMAKQLAMRGVPRFVAFGVAVWASTFVPGVFGWTVASGISPATWLVQLADVVGERGVSALIAISAALGAEAIRTFLASKGPWRSGALPFGRSVQIASISLGIPAAMMISGAFRVRSVEAARAAAPKVRVALIQPATQARMRWDPREADGIARRLTMITKIAEQRGTDLVVWPEAAFPYAMSSTSKNDLIGPFAVLQPGIRGPVLTGLLMHAPLEGERGSYNSAALFHDGHVDAPYHKMHLLAFGESVPLSSTFPLLRRAFVRGTGMVPGDHQVLMESGPIHAAVLNCFEDTLPEAGLEASSVNPNLLVNITNDAWFAGTSESELHVRLATMRAIELRKDFVRAVNLGTTSWIDATGRVRARYNTDVAGSLPTVPALLEGKTIYASLGDFSGLLLLGLLGGATWLGQAIKRKRRTA